MKQQKGFTILELLVSIAIIAILSTFILVSMGSIKEKGRDATRMSHLKQLSNALNLYYSNHNNFPVQVTQITITGNDTFSLTLEDDEVIPEVQPDPLFPSPAYTYKYQSLDGTTYTITFCLETDSIQKYAQGCANTMTP